MAIATIPKLPKCENREYFVVDGVWKGRQAVFSHVGAGHTWPPPVRIHYEGLVISQDHRYHYPICPSHVVALAFQNITNVHKEHNITANSLCKPYGCREPLIERKEF